MDRAEAAEQEWRAAIAALYEMTWFDHPRGPAERCEHCVGEAAIAESVADAAGASHPFEGEAEVAQALLHQSAIDRLDAPALDLSDDDDFGDRFLYATERLQRRRARQLSG